MKNTLLVIVLATFCFSISAQESPMIRIETENTALILKVGKNQRLYQTYLGAKLLNGSDYDAVSK